MIYPSITPEMHYDDWAAGYDRDVQGWEYTAPEHVISHIREPLINYREEPVVLDVGIGTGLLSEKIRMIRPDSYIAGIDISSEMLRQCKNKKIADRLEKIDISSERFPFRNNSFDLVVASGVMENVKNIGNAIQQMTRVLRPDGLLIFTYLPAQKNPLQEIKNMGWRPGRMNNGKFVLGSLKLFSHSRLKINTFCSLAGIQREKTDTFLGYRTYVVLKVNYELYMGTKIKR